MRRRENSAGSSRVTVEFQSKAMLAETAHRRFQVEDDASGGGDTTDDDYTGLERDTLSEPTRQCILTAQKSNSLFRNKVKIKISSIKWIKNRLKKKMVLINYLTTFI